MGCELEADPQRYLGVLRAAFDKHYAESTDVWTADPEMRVSPALIQGHLKLPATTRALDIGCGAGHDVDYFARLYAHADGIDLHPHAEWPARTRANVRFVATDLLGFEGRGYDLVFDNGCFHHQHPEHYARYLARVVALMAAGAWYVVSTFKNAALTERVDDSGRLHRYFTDAELHCELRAAGLEPVHELDIWRQRCQDYYRLSFCRTG